MRKDITVAAELRSGRGKNENIRLRVKGQIPAILYGAFKDPVAIAVNPKDVTKVLHSRSGHNTIFNIGIAGGETSPAMFVDWQYDPVKDTLLHVDLKRIDLNKRLRVAVPVLVQGEPVGVKIQGGLLEVITREVEIECLPDEIPEQFTMDVSELSIGQSVRAGDVPMDGSMKLMSAAEIVIAHVVALRAEEAPAAAEGAAATPEAGAAAEPEVLKKGKKEEEEAEADKKKK